MNQFKVVFIGSTNVGKSSIISVLNTDQILKNPSPTSNSSVFTREYNFDGNQFVVNYWDTAGQEKFKSVRSFYFRGACLAISVFDITDEESFLKLKTCIDDFQSVTAAEFYHNIIVVANKSDLLENDKNSFDKPTNYRIWCNERGYQFVETSAVTKNGIKDMEHLVAIKMTELTQASRANTYDIPLIDGVTLLDESASMPKTHCC